jgi:hypothetical protein
MGRFAPLVFRFLLDLPAMSDLLPPTSLADQLEVRQDDVIRQLDELNARIEEAIALHLPKQVEDQS